MSDNARIVNKPVALSPDGTIVIIPKWLVDNLKEAVTNKYTGSLTVHMVNGGFSNGELKKTLRENGNGTR